MTKFNFTCKGCPMQAEGKVYDYEWYFRARGGGWTFEVGSKVLETPSIFGCSGDYDDNEKSGFGAGWMPIEKCESIIDACLALYEIARPDLVGHVIER